MLLLQCDSSLGGAFVLFSMALTFTSMQAFGKNLTDAGSHTNHAQHQVLIRHKRQARSMCPSGPASGTDNGRSFLIFYSPDSRKDVKLSNDGDKWPRSELKKLDTNGFNSSQGSVIYLHAFTQSAKAAWLEDVRKRYDEIFPKGSDKKPTFNLFFFDWSSFSQLSYSTSASWVPHLGEVLANYLSELQRTRSYSANKVHLISYSLSTHIAGQAGRRLEQSNKLAQITALDPTGVCFHERDDFARKYALRPSDARLVVARHYDMNRLGAKRAIGGVDIFVNGGRNQPSGRRRRSKRQIGEGEEEGAVRVRQNGYMSDHSRAAHHESSQVKRGSSAGTKECHEVAYACRSYKAFSAGECADCGARDNKCYYIDNLEAKSNEMRDKLKDPATRDYKRRTKMYIKTGAGPNYCIHHYQVLVRLKAGTSTSVRQSLGSSGIELDFGSNVRTIVKNQLNGNEAQFSALVLRGKRIRIVKEIKVKKTNSDNSISAQRFKKSLDFVELNYMSHPLASERAKASAKFCPSSNADSLIRC